jgi:hypothetical protein
MSDRMDTETGGSREAHNIGEFDHQLNPNHKGDSECTTATTHCTPRTCNL